MAGIMNDSGLRDLHMRYNNEQEMQCDESTIDDSGIQPTYSTTGSDWNGQQSSYSSPATYSKSHSKGSKKVKSEDADEDIEIDNFVHQDVQRIPVKTLRKVIPKLRIAVYCSDSLTSGKRKLKHLWDERPADWPQAVPFKDPNNACKDVKKPGKDELGPMFNFLKAKYLENQNSLHQSATADASESNYSFSHQVIAESSTDKESAFFYSSVSNNPILPQIRFESQSTDQNHFLINPKSEPSPYVDIGELMNQDVKQQHTFTGPQQLVSMQPRLPTIVSKPPPVVELYSRLDKKYTDVMTLSPPDNRQSVIHVLSDVQQAVIKRLYDEITPNDTRVCLMFLDAGHQMEALLDVMLVLGQVDILLLQNGCQEIIKKFNTQNVNFVFGPLMNPPLSKREPLLPSSIGSFKGDSDLFSDMSDDEKVEDSILFDLGLDPYNHGKSQKTDSKSSNLENSSHVQLFKPRRGAEEVLEDGMGIQTRAVQPSSPESDDGKSSFGVVPVKGMRVMQNESPPPKLNDQDKLNRILQDLQDPTTKMLQLMNQYVHEGSAVPNLHVNKEQYAMMVDFDDATLEDINDIITEDQSPHVVNMLQFEYPSWRQETGDGQSNQRSQLLPSSATSATSIIPSMVEDLSCADSESEDSDNSLPPRMLGFDRGPAFAGSSYTGRAFESFTQWREGNQC